MQTPLFRIEKARKDLCRPKQLSRMGNDPATSVVNAFSRAHGIPNRFIVDGSNLVTSARQQPMATLHALGYRAADYAIRAAKCGELGKRS